MAASPNEVKQARANANFTLDSGGARRDDGAMAAHLPDAIIHQTFQHRSARLIALSRTVLAAFFALAVWLDPSPSAETSDITFLLLVGYTVFAALILFVTWASWWLEARLSAWAHMIDLVVFTILIFLTEGYVSPFFTFFVFLVLSAAIRVGWREALFTTLLVLLLFFAASLVAAKTIDPPDFQLQRFMVRGANLVVLSLMIVWFGVSQPALRGRVAAGPLDDLPALPGPPIAAVMAYAASALGAERIVFAWLEAEEPWINVWSLHAGALTRAKLGPDEFPQLVDAELAAQPFLFESRRNRVLRAPGEQSRLSTAAIDASFRDRFGIDTGLAIPVRGLRYEGELFALEVPGLCADDLRIAGSVGAQVGATLDRSALFEATEQAVAAHTRMALARDLHDSVVQAFSGISLKLQGLRNGGLASEVDDEMKQLLAQLAEEQRDLRGLIANLRDPRAMAEKLPLADSLARLVERLEQQWRIRCALTIGAEVDTVFVPQHDIDQLVREAVANAVRHGHAGAIDVAAAAADGALRLSITDDGKGFPVSGEFDDRALADRQLGPRSLYERVHSLGGTMHLSTHAGDGSTLTMLLPSREEQA